MRNKLKTSLEIFLVMAVCIWPLAAANNLAYTEAAYIPTVSTTVISLETALHKIIENNLTAEILRYEHQQADSAYERYQTKFSPFISALAGKQNTNLDPASLDSTYGTRLTKEESSLNIGKTFKSGTTVIGGYKDTYIDYLEPSAYLTTQMHHSEYWHSPAMYVQIKQDLLKNSFGYTDRLQDEILQNMRDSKQVATQYQLSGLVVSGIFDYWTVAEYQKKWLASKSELMAYKKIYEAVEANVDIGLYEKYNLYQFNALIAGSEAKLAMSQQRYQKAVHKMFRNLNMTEVTNNALELVSLDEIAHAYDTEVLYKTALAKRADIRQAELAIAMVEKQVQILGNQGLPEAQLQWQGTGLGVDEKYAEANIEASKFKYSNWETKLTVSKVLFDNDNSIQKRDAEYKFAQAKLNLQNLNNQVRDEVRDGVEQINTAYTCVEKTKVMVADSQRYLDALLIRLKQGKLSTLELKTAVDMMVAANNSYAEAVSGYNMALLNLDLVTNMVFEKYHLETKVATKEQK